MSAVIFALLLVATALGLERYSTAHSLDDVQGRLEVEDHLVEAGEPAVIHLVVRNSGPRWKMFLAAKLHLNNVGLTLNYGIPGQTMQSWHNSLHAAVIMQAGHITAEPLAVTDAEGMPNAAERFEMFRYACEYLPENGYKMYAAGCFARPGYEYRARAMEWNGDDIIGMGVNGGSVYDGYAVRNTNNLKLYIKNAGDFEKLTAQAAQLDENALMLRYLRGRMKLNDGVVEPLFRERFGQELPQEFSTLLDKAVENGLAQRTADGWMPTLEGLFRGEVL